MKATIEANANTIHDFAKTWKQEVNVTNVSPTEIRDLMTKAGSKIASVHFTKRSDNTIRKMCYRLGVTNPKTAIAPKGKVPNKKKIDIANLQLTVYDVNKVVRNKDGDIEYDDNGKQKRGAWRTVPLENVIRVCVDGVTYHITK